MTKRLFLRLALALGIAGLLLAGVVWSVLAGTGDDVRPENVSAHAWASTDDGEVAEFLVVMGEQASLAGADTLSEREERLQYVYDALRDVALRSQADLLRELDETGVPHRSFYIVNMLLVRGDRGLLTRLATHPDVAYIAANPRVRQALPEREARDLTPLAIEGIEWGVGNINADDVWTLGYTGTGIVVAGQDTGYDWQHPALLNRYRGYNRVTATHNYSWHDAIHSGGSSCGADSPFPCDDQSHGTHTMGTIVGDDGGGNQIGVAPGARWIGCRNMDEGVGTPATYAECFEFFLAPYPIGGEPMTDGVPSLAPHVINNSWTCPASEGCSPLTLQAVVENVRAAGIAVVASAGNTSTQRCGTVYDPPAIYDAAFSVGATSSGDAIASLSSWGPVTSDGSGRPKPDISAPGVSVRSSVPGGGYGTMSGTSMAGPHVVGAIALLWSAAPELISDVDATECLISRTARPHTTTQTCGGDQPGDVPNNVYGWGIVDALGAVKAATARLVITKTATFAAGVALQQLDYTIHVTNTSNFTLTSVVLTDAIPAGGEFAWASEGHAYNGGVLTWAVPSLPSGAHLAATFGVTVVRIPGGTPIVNEAYGVGAAELLGPVMGAAVRSVAPWRVAMALVLREWGP